MMKLSVRFYRQIDDGSVLVQWRIGVKNQGVVRVIPPDYWRHAGALGELTAIRYLLFKRKIFDRTPASGRGYVIAVSQQMTYKLAQPDAEGYGVPYANFLRGHMEDASIVVEEGLEFFDDPETHEPVDVYPDETYFSSGYLVESPSIGLVEITRHAVHQYNARVSSGKPKDPWTSLTQRILNPELRQEAIPERIRQHKARRFGRADNVEVWGHPTSKFLFLVLNEQKRRTLVTCFERPVKYRSK